MTPRETPPSPPSTVAGYRADLADEDDVDAALAAVDAVRAAHPAPDGTADVVVQLVDAARVWGAHHLQHAARLAHRARARGDALADDPAVEVLCYAAGRRQITEALDLLGLRAGTTTVAALVVHPDPHAVLADLEDRLGWTRDDDVLEGDPRVLDALDVPEAERAVVPRDRWGDLVLERVALLDVEK